MIKLRRLLALAIMALALPALGAEPADAVDGRHFGVRVQYEMNTSTKYSHMFHMGPGFAVGANYYAPFANRFYFNTELMLGYDTFGYRGDLENKYNKRHFDGKLKNINLRLPLEFGFKFVQNRHLLLSAYTGPDIIFNFKVKADYTETRPGGSEKVSKNYTNGGAELCWTLGIGADINRHWHAHVQGSLGLTSLCDTDDLANGPDGASFKRAEFAVGIGYNF